MQTTAKVQLCVREMHEGDVSRLEELVQAAYRGGKAEVSWKNEHDIVRGPRIKQQQLLDLVGSEEAVVLVVERVCDQAPEPELCGCVLIEREKPDSVVIGMLAVDPAAQNLGVGRKLVEAAEGAALRRFQARTAHMHVASVRGELLHWYERLGYSLTGELKPFPGPEAGIEALREGLQFAVIEKKLSAESTCFTS